MFLGQMATFYCYRKAKKILLIFTPAYLTALKSTFKGYPPLFTIDLLATQIGYTATYGRAGKVTNIFSFLQSIFLTKAVNHWRSRCINFIFIFIEIFFGGFLFFSSCKSRNKTSSGDPGIFFEQQLLNKASSSAGFTFSWRKILNFIQ